MEISIGVDILISKPFLFTKKSIAMKVMSDLINLGPMVSAKHGNGILLV